MDTAPGWYSPAADESPEWGPCPTCGTANAASARFCQACGRPLVDPGPDPLTVDVLTAIVAELVSASDAFALASDADDRLVGVRDAFVASGGILRDLPGSPHTVAAVFGPAPRDGISTLTAVRSAIAARETATSGDVALRLGVGASDVRGDDEQAVELWRGRVVDLAYRLSRMAAPGEVILGEGAYRLIRDVVEADAIDPRADLDGDDVGPLRLRGIRDGGAWATPSHDEAGGRDATVSATAGASVAAAVTGRTFDPWADRFGTRPMESATEEPPIDRTGATGATEDGAEPADTRAFAVSEEPRSQFGAPDEPDTPSGEAQVQTETDGDLDADAETPETDTEVSSPFADVADVADDAEAVAGFAETEPRGAFDDGDDEPLLSYEVSNEDTPPAESLEDTEAHEHTEDREDTDADDAPVDAPRDQPDDEASVDHVIADGQEQAAAAEHVPALREAEGSPLLEREAVLAQLRDGLDRAIETNGPVRIAVGGPRGGGRTAAVRWFAAETADRAWTVELACRPADAGGTAWPFAALIRAVTGIEGPIEPAELEPRLRGALGPGGETHAGPLATYLRGDAGGAPPVETRAALAALLTATVGRRPLIVIADDADRAPPGARAVFDAVLERVAGPLLVLEIVGDTSADVLVPPLSNRASAELVERLLAYPNLPPDATASIVTACGGLPLAVEHLVAMLADDGHLRWEYGRWTPTIDLASLPLPADLTSLVARRVGGLAQSERRVASVAALAEGPFDAALVAAALDADASDIANACTALADRGILRPAGEDAFAFGHDILAERAATYVDSEAALAIHLAAADRLSRDQAPGPDIDETIGAHLERAYRTPRSAGDPDREALGRRAAEHLVRAARGAADVGGEDASLSLLRRAAAVLPSNDAGRATLLLDSAATLAARGERGSAERLLGDAIRAARAAGDELVELRAVVARARILAMASRTDDQIEALRDASDAAIAIAEARHDALAAAAGWSARGWVHTVRGHFAGAADAFEHAAGAAGEAGHRREELAALRELAAAIVDGPAPVEESIARCGTVLDRARGTTVEADVASALAVLLARVGRSQEAADTLDRAVALAPEQGSPPVIAIRSALVALHDGAANRAEAPLRAALGGDPIAGDRGALSAWLARVLTELGRTDEALDAADDAAALADEDDVLSHVTWRAATARCLATRGRHAEARALVRLALRLADQTDLAELRARARLDLADVLLASGRANEAAPAARAALRALERKGSMAEAARARAILDRAMGKAAPAEPADAGAASAHDAADERDASSPDPDTEPTDDATMPADERASGDRAPGERDAATVAGSAPGASPDAGPADASKRDRHWFW